MSWSLNVKAKAPEAEAELEKQFKIMAGHLCPEPEETFKQKIREFVKEVIKSEPPNVTLAISAYGSQGQQSSQRPYNALSLKVDVFFD